MYGPSRGQLGFESVSGLGWSKRRVQVVLSDDSEEEEISKATHGFKSETDPHIIRLE